MWWEAPTHDRVFPAEPGQETQESWLVLLLPSLLRDFVRRVDDFHRSMEPKFANVKFHLIPARFAKPYTYYLYEQQRVQQWLDLLPRVPFTAWLVCLRTDIVLFQILGRLFLANHQGETFRRWFCQSPFRGHPHAYFQRLRSCVGLDEVRAQVLRMTPELYHDLDPRPPTDWSLFVLALAGPMTIQ